MPKEKVVVPTRMVCGDLPPGALVGRPNGRLAELKLIVAAPLEAELVRSVGASVEASFTLSASIWTKSSPKLSTRAC